MSDAAEVIRVMKNFWMASMTPLKRRNGNQHLHCKTEEYRRSVRRKMDAYHRFIRIGLVGQGIMGAISTSVPLFLTS